jgi:hypothetical protein
MKPFHVKAKAKPTQPSVEKVEDALQRNPGSTTRTLALVLLKELNAERGRPHKCSIDYFALRVAERLHELRDSRRAAKIGTVWYHCDVVVP